MRDRKRMDPDGSGVWKELGGIERGETYQDLFCEKKNLLLIKGKYIFVLFKILSIFTYF